MSVQLCSLIGDVYSSIHLFFSLSLSFGNPSPLRVSKINFKSYHNNFKSYHNKRLKKLKKEKIKKIKVLQSVLTVVVFPGRVRTLRDTQTGRRYPPGHVERKGPLCLIRRGPHDGLRDRRTLHRSKLEVTGSRFRSLGLCWIES